MILRHYFTNPIRKIRTDGGDMPIFRRVGFIGDSLSSGEHEGMMNGQKSWNDYYEYSWGQYMARTCGFEAINFSRGGLRADTFLYDYCVNVKTPFIEENKCQCYFIALGVNDMNHLNEYKDGFGSLNDVDWDNEENNKMSYVGQYVKIIQKLRKLEPKCRIFVVTTPKEKPETKQKKQNFDAIQKFLLELPKFFKFLYVINLRKYAPIYSRKFGKKYFLGGHQNALGYKLTSDMLATYATYYIEKYYEEFKQVGFIGKDTHNENFIW